MNEETERKRQEEVNRKLAADNAIAQAEKMKNDLLIIKREYKIVTKLLDEKRKTETLHSVSGRNRHMLSSMNHVKQDKFRFLASKFNSCSKLTSSVLSFPSSEILLGKGVYGQVKLATFNTLGIPVAVKTGKSGSFFAVSEAKIMQQLAGHICFPFVYRTFNHMLVMEFVGELCHTSVTSATISAQLKLGQITNDIWINICVQLADAIKFMHSRSVLHNDLKSDNVLMKKVSSTSHIPKVIDFGKATCTLNPVIYELDEKQKDYYNVHHKHLAYELRNIKGSKQSEMTDIYSLGMIYSGIAVTLNNVSLKTLSVSMIDEKPLCRPNVVGVIKRLQLTGKE